MFAGKIEFDPAPSAASREIVGPSTNRKRIVFFPPAVGRVTLGNDPVPADGQGYVLAAGQGTVAFDYDHAGDIVYRPWHALYSAGATAVGWIQTMG